MLNEIDVDRKLKAVGVGMLTTLVAEIMVKL